ncbi:MAG: hypothetical protein WC322_07065 [Candidatus Paceibacterota bacterium]
MNRNLSADLKLHAEKLRRLEQRRAREQRAFINQQGQKALLVFEQLKDESLGFPPGLGVWYRTLKQP